MVVDEKVLTALEKAADDRRRHIKGVIPEKSGRAANRKKKGSRGGRPVSYDTDLCKERATVESVQGTPHGRALHQQDQSLARAGTPRRTVR
ncbi:hypothetical protein [Streptosporangium roseum]|uniref:hypothetical protein n=1 Tax=Streptosporangium roseum TaxID=2001 RepID=UPI0011D1C6DB